MRKELRFLMKLQGLEYLAMTNEELMFYKARKKLEVPFRAFVNRRRRLKLEISTAIRLQSAYRAYRERAYSYVEALRLDQYPVIYFLKEQRQIF